LVRPVLSCPYCGAFRSAVSLDGAVPPPPRTDRDPSAPVGVEPTGELFPPTDDVIYAGDAGFLEDEPAAPYIDAEPAVHRPPEPPMVPPERSEPPLPTPERPEPSAGPGEPAGEPEPAAPRRDRPALDAVPAAGRSRDPGAARRTGRIEPSVSGGRPRPAPDARRTGRLDRGAAAPVPDHEAADVHEPDEAAAPELPREPAVPRAPSRRRRASPEVSRRRAQDDAAAGSAWLATGEDDESGEDEPSIDEVLRDAEHEPRRRGRGRSLVHVPDEDAAEPVAEDEKRRRGGGGWIALLLFLLVVAGGVGYAVYWVDKVGIADLLRSPSREISSLGEATQIAVPAEWTSVAEPGAGGATAVLVSADGPFRMRVDGTVYTLDGGRSVRVPVKASTLLELKALGGPVTASITRLGETGGAQ
jgi:hypothetical protein